MSSPDRRYRGAAGAAPGPGGAPGPGAAPGPGGAFGAGPVHGGPGRRGRDRHGRGLRGRLVPASAPLSRTRAEIFDDLVLDSVEALEQRFSKELAGVEFAVEDVPPDLNVYDSDVLEDGEVPLARLLPGRPGRHGVPPRIVLYRRPLEFRAADREDLADLVHDVIIEQVANLLGVAPEDLD
ncbi:metallopeptidase family protein [Planosporangium flavigriseum]|nr:metallopeptidase family protein [Planosporangium flavigriseum]